LIGSNKWEESGVFAKQWKLHQGRVCYISARTKCTIRWNPNLGAWLIDRRGLAFDNEASLIAYQDVAHPGLITTNWSVYNGDLHAWVNANNFRIECFNAFEFLIRSGQIMNTCYSNYSFHRSYGQSIAETSNASSCVLSNSGEARDSLVEELVVSQMLPTEYSENNSTNANDISSNNSEQVFIGSSADTSPTQSIPTLHEKSNFKDPPGLI